MYERFEAGYTDHEQVELTPSAAQWARFWRTVEELGVWQWAERYEPGERFEPGEVVRDGVHWSVTLESGRRKVQSSGDGAGPDARDLDESSVFDAFLCAVSRLAGSRPFS